MIHHVRVRTIYSCKKTFHRKNDARFFAIIFSHNLCDEKLFLPVFLFTHFCALKKCHLKKYSSIRSRKAFLSALPLNKKTDTCVSVFYYETGCAICRSPVRGCCRGRLSPERRREAQRRFRTCRCTP